MSYTVGSKKVIKDDNTTQLSTLTVSTSDYLEITEVMPAAPNQIGENYAFSAGGGNAPSPQPYSSGIDKWPYAQTSGTATDVGDLLEQKTEQSGHTDGSNGYTSGGFVLIPVAAGSIKIEKFPFAISSGTATDFSSIFTPPATGQRYAGGAGHSSFVEGFSSGGYDPYSGNVRISQISKFPFSSPVSAVTDAGDLLSQSYSLAAASTSSEAFNAGGGALPSDPYQPTSNPSFGIRLIQKFPFSIASGTATDVGSLTQPRWSATGHTSSTDGFMAGGTGPGPVPSGNYVFTIEKYPFAISSGSSTDVGDTILPYTDMTAGNSGTSSGHRSGQYNSGAIEKFPFAISGGTASNIGSLANTKRGTCDNVDD